MAWNFSELEHEIPISGDLAFLRFRVSAADGPEFDDRLSSFIHETRREFESQVAATIHEIVGKDFELVRLGIRKGSVELLLVIGTVYVTISQYKDFVESINLLVSHLRTLIRRFFERTQVPGISVIGNWAPSQELLRATAGRPRWQRDGITTTVIWYLILSHAAMSALLLWSVMRWCVQR